MIIFTIFCLFAEQKKQRVSEIKTGIDEAEALVLLFLLHWKAVFISSVLWF